MFQLHPQLEKDGIVLGQFPLCLLLAINDSQYPWFVLVPQRENIKEVYELSETDQQQFHAESLAVSKAIMQEWQGDKLNVAALGNMVPQLHVHHIVRFKEDIAWPGPIWGQHPLVAYSTQERQALIQRVTQLALPDFTPASSAD